MGLNDYIKEMGDEIDGHTRESSSHPMSVHGVWLRASTWASVGPGSLNYCGHIKPQNLALQVQTLSTSASDFSLP